MFIGTCKCSRLNYMSCSKNRNLKVPFADFSMNSKQKNMSANFRFFNFCSHSLMHFLDEVYEIGMNFLYLPEIFFVSMLKFTTFGSVLWTLWTRQKIYLSNIKNSSQIHKLRLENALRNNYKNLKIWNLHSHFFVCCS